MSGPIAAAFARAEAQARRTIAGRSAIAGNKAIERYRMVNGASVVE
jgi:hypothetical protein